MENKTTEFDLVIEPNGVQAQYLKDIFNYRELFYFFAWRDNLVRYKHAFLGFIWAILRPLLNMAVLAFVFGKIAHLSPTGINYPLFVLVGVLPWQLFSSAVLDTSFCLVQNSPLLSKVYFPRIIIPTSLILVNLVDFFVSFSLVFLAVIALVGISWNLCWLPLIVLLNISLCIGVGLWISALTVKYHDTRFIMQFIVQFGLFLSPIGYSILSIPEQWRYVYYLNPMVGIIESFRWSLLGGPSTGLVTPISFSIIETAFLLVTGYLYFRKTERTLADII